MSDDATECTDQAIPYTDPTVRDVLAFAYVLAVVWVMKVLADGIEHFREHVNWEYDY